MKAFLYKGRIRVSPVPKNEVWQLWVWMKKPLNEGSKPMCYADVYAGQKFYALPCEEENIIGVAVRLK